MITAVLDARCGLSVGANDIYLNVAGGLRIAEPAADLAVAAALVSALTETPVPTGAVVFGEIALSGEVRPVGHTETRLKEAAKLGFTEAWMPVRRGKRREAAVADGLRDGAYRPSEGARRAPGSPTIIATRPGAATTPVRSRVVNGLDLAILGVIALSAVFAFARGFVREALSIVAWVGAALITLWGFNQVYAIVVRFVTTPLLADLVAGAGLFVISLIVLTILTGFLARFVQSSALSPIDRTLGLIFGLVRGAFLVSLAYLVLDISLPQNDRPGWVKQAKSEPFLAQGAELLRNALPEPLKLKSAAAADDTQRTLERAKDAEKAMRALSSPVPPLPAKPGEEQTPSYKPGDRRDMNRLIENTR